MTRTEHLLTIVMEECNEVAQRASKALRFGLDEVQEGQAHDNAARIMQEFADLTGAIWLLQDAGLLPDVRHSQITAKVEKVEAWLTYSEKQGTVDK